MPSLPRSELLAPALLALLVSATGCPTPVAPGAVVPAAAPVPRVVAVVQAGSFATDPVVAPGCLSQDGATVVYADRGTLYALGTDSGAPRAVADLGGADVHDVYWAGGRVIVVTDEGASAWDPATDKLTRVGSVVGPLPTGLPADGVGRGVAAPDGATVAVVAGGDLWIGAAGSAAARVTNGLSVSGAPVWRGDGQQLAFSVMQPAEGAGDAPRSLDVYELDPSTHRARRVYGTAEDDVPLGYRPDGSLAVATFFHRDEVAVLDTDGHPHAIAAGSAPRFEPDGLHLGFTQGTRHVADADPFAALPGLTTGLVALDAAGHADGAPVTLVSSQAADATPVFTADGSWLFYRSREGTGGGADVWVRTAMGTGPHAVSRDGRVEGTPSLTPDDRRVVWSARSGAGAASAHLFIASFDGQSGQTTEPAALNVTGYAGPMEDPRLSPDGSQILFVGAGAKPHRRAVYLVATGGGAADRVVEFDSDDPRGGAAFTPDAKAIVYAAAAPGGYQLFRVAADGTAAPTQVSASVWACTQPAISVSAPTSGLYACTVWQHTVSVALLAP